LDTPKSLAIICSNKNNRKIIKIKKYWVSLDLILWKQWDFLDRENYDFLWQFYSNYVHCFITQFDGGAWYLLKLGKVIWYYKILNCKSKSKEICEKDEPWASFHFSHSNQSLKRYSIDKIFKKSKINWTIKYIKFIGTWLKTHLSCLSWKVEQSAWQSFVIQIIKISQR
jgi:hypothetical protein